MILQALRELAISERLVGDPDYEFKPVSWQINLHEDSTLNTVEDLRSNVNEGTKRKPKFEGKPTLVPRQPIRTSGDQAFFLVDKAEYVFGIDPSEKRPVEKLQARAALFRASVKECAEATGDTTIGAVARFLSAIAADTSPVRAAIEGREIAPNDLFAFRVGRDPRFVHLSPAAAEYWKRQRQAVSVGTDAQFQCLITGEVFGEVGLFPLIKRLPGGTTSGVALVSHNARAFESYGLSGNDNAPISRTAAEQAATALNRLLSPNFPNPERPDTALPKRLIRLSGNTVVCFWTVHAGPLAAGFLDDLPDLLEGEDEGTVREAYRSIWHGREIDLKDPAAFYALTLSGSQGRAVVRDWFETSLSGVVRNLAGHFRDLGIVRTARRKDESSVSPAVPLRWLMESLSAEGRTERVLESLEAHFVRSAFTGVPYPFQLLQRALVRARVEAGRDEWMDRARRDARAAMLKAVLNRRRRFDPQTASRYQEVSPEMNPNYESPGYALGLLMAVLERLQSAALGDVNASLVDRYFSAASATPRIVFVRLLRNSQHHARKARDSDNSADRVQALRCSRLIDCIASRFDVSTRRYPPRGDGLPTHLDLEQQGLFVLGYHQMRYWLWMNNEERAVWEAEYPDAPRAFRWLKQPVDELIEAATTAS